MELNNREIAICIYIGILAILFLKKKDIRESVINLLKIFFSDKLRIVFELNLIYFLSSLLFLAIIDYWDISLLKGSILWFLFTSIAFMPKIFMESEKEDFIKNIVISSLTIVVLLEYLSNLFVFDLLLELFLQPVLFTIVAIIAFSETDSKYAKVKTLFEWVLSILGLIIIIFATYNLFENIELVFTIDNLKEFTLPPILTILYLPFIYFLALYAKYEYYFVKLNHINKDNPLNSYVKYKIVLFCNVRLRKLIRFTKDYPVLEYKTKDDVKNIFKNYGITSSTN